MDHLEDVLTPPLLDALRPYEISVVVAFGDVVVRYLNLARVIERLEVDDNVGVVRPLLKLPLHLDHCVLLNLLVNAYDRPIEHLQLSTGLWV